MNNKRLRCAEKTEHRFEFNDQLRLNCALEVMNPVWKYEWREKTFEKMKLATTASGFSVTMLPEKMMCRVHCSKHFQWKYYVWHKPSSKHVESKTNSSEQFKLWFLKSDWENQSSSANGEQWLKDIHEKYHQINTSTVLPVTTER